MKFNAAKDGVSEIDILIPIGEQLFTDGFTQKDAKVALDAIKEPNIRVNISTLGGSAEHAFAIHDMLKIHPATVETVVIGATASAGTIIAQGGDSRKISDNSPSLIHRVQSLVGGDANAMEKEAKDNKVFDGRMAGIYAKASGGKTTAEEFLAVMDKNEWMTPDEAVELGLADRTFEPGEPDDKEAAATSKQATCDAIDGCDDLPDTPEWFAKGEEPEAENKEDKKAEVSRNKLSKAIDTLSDKLESLINPKAKEEDTDSEESIGEVIKEMKAEVKKANKENESADDENSELKENFKKMKKELGKLKAASVKPAGKDTDEDPDAGEGEGQLSEQQEANNKNASAVRSYQE